MGDSSARLVLEPDLFTKEVAVDDEKSGAGSGSWGRPSPLKSMDLRREGPRQMRMGTLTD